MSKRDKILLLLMIPIFLLLLYLLGGMDALFNQRDDSQTYSVPPSTTASPSASDSPLSSPSSQPVTESVPATNPSPTEKVAQQQEAVTEAPSDPDKALSDQLSEEIAYRRSIQKKMLQLELEKRLQIAERELIENEVQLLRQKLAKYQAESAIQRIQNQTAVKPVNLQAFRLLLLLKVDDHWKASVSYQEKILDIHVGMLLPGGVRVLSIDSLGIMLDNQGVISRLVLANK